MEKKVVDKKKMKGKPQSKRYTPEKKAEILQDLFLSNNMQAVAKMHEVPVSTLKEWRKKIELAPEKEQKIMWEAARIKQIDTAIYNAAAGAKLASEMISKRMLIGARNTKRAEEIRKKLLFLEDEDERKKLLEELKANPEISDSAMASFLRVLMSTADKPAKNAVEKEATIVKVVIEKDENTYDE